MVGNMSRRPSGQQDYARAFVRLNHTRRARHAVVPRFENAGPVVAR